MLTQKQNVDEEKCYLEVINPTLLSSNLLTPDSLPRLTQPSIGQQLVKYKDLKGSFLINIRYR